LDKLYICNFIEKQNKLKEERKEKKKRKEKKRKEKKKVCGETEKKRKKF
jgi:hypothetical protein